MIVDGCRPIVLTGAQSQTKCWEILHFWRCCHYFSCIFQRFAFKESPGRDVLSQRIDPWLLASWELRVSQIEKLSIGPNILIYFTHVHLTKEPVCTISFEITSGGMWGPLAPTPRPEEWRNVHSKFMTGRATPRTEPVPTTGGW